MTLCSCRTPQRQGNWCLRCYGAAHIVPVERLATPFDADAPGDAAGEATISPAAFSAAELERIARLLRREDDCPPRGTPRPATSQ